MNNNNLRKANMLKKTSWYTLLLLSVLTFSFALISGAEEYDNSLIGIIKNSPNALPWLVLIFLVFLAWVKELMGGILIIIFGIGLIYFFNFSGPNFWWITFILTLIIPILGSFFILSWYLKNKKMDH